VFGAHVYVLGYVPTLLEWDAIVQLAVPVIPDVVAVSENLNPE
jgi:hypothetical protein